MYNDYSEDDDRHLQTFYAKLPTSGCCSKRPNTRTWRRQNLLPRCEFVCRCKSLRAPISKDAPPAQDVFHSASRPGKPSHITVTLAVLSEFSAGELLPAGCSFLFLGRESSGSLCVRKFQDTNRCRKTRTSLKSDSNPLTVPCQWPPVYIFDVICYLC